MKDLSIRINCCRLQISLKLGHEQIGFTPEGSYKMKSIQRNLIIFLACHFLPVPTTSSVRFDFDHSSRTPGYRVQLSGVISNFCFRVVESDMMAWFSVEFKSQDVYETTSEYEVEDDREKEITNHDFADLATKTSIGQSHNASTLLKLDRHSLVLYQTYSVVLRC